MENFDNTSNESEPKEAWLALVGQKLVRVYRQDGRLWRDGTRGERFELTKKTCPHCRSGFITSNKVKVYCERRCKALHLTKARYKINRVMIMRYARTYYRANQATILATKRAAYRARPAGLVRCDRPKTEAQRQKRLAAQKRYRDSHKVERKQRDTVRHRAKKEYKAADFVAIVQWTKRWKSKNVVRCYWCDGKFNPVQCHEDHIVPLIKGGVHAIENLCISCAECNLKKGKKDAAKWSQTLNQKILI